MSFESRIPNAFEFSVVDLTLLIEFLSLLKHEYLFIPKTFALSIMYGKSKLTMLYPVIMSGSTAIMKSRHLVSSSYSFSNE